MLRMLKLMAHARNHLMDLKKMAFDQDGSGAIDAAELRVALRALGYNVEDTDTVEIIEKYGADRSGSIDLQRFRALVRDLPELDNGPQGILID